MAGLIIWLVISFGCAALFFGIGLYAQRLEKPMWFWSGIEVKAEDVTDVAAYNRANARMWKRYSLWFWVSGFLYILSPTAAVVVLMLGCTVGGGLLIANYKAIERTYKK